MFVSRFHISLAAAVLGTLLSTPAFAQHAVRVINAQNWYDNGTITSYVMTGANTTTLFGVWVEPDALQPVFASAFNLLLGLETDGFTVEQISAGADLSPEWEYFTYRFETPPSSCTNCPPTLLRLIGIANLNDNIDPSQDAYRLSGCIAEMRVRSSTNANQSNQCFLAEFCSCDCGDNTITSFGGDTLYVADSTVTLCDTFDPASCTGSPGRTSSLILSKGAMCLVDFFESGGDVNLDAVYFTVADAVLFVRFFLYGDAVLSPDPAIRAIQGFESDVNHDGLQFTVADYVALRKIVTGEWESLYFSAPTPPTDETPDHRHALSRSALPDTYELTWDSPGPIGGAHFVFDLNGTTVGEPRVDAGSSVTGLQYRVDGNKLRLLIAPTLENTGDGIALPRAGTLQIPVSDPSAISLAGSDFSDPDGAVIRPVLRAASVPTGFALAQNYPNPFNGETVIRYDLREPGVVTLAVFDVLGRRVRTLVSGFQPEGRHVVSWDGRDADGHSVASGVYFYRIVTGHYTAARQMTLMK